VTTRDQIGLAVLGVLGIIGVFVLSNANKIAAAVADVADAAGKYWPLPANGEPYRDIIQAAASDNSVPFDLIARDLWQESRFKPDAYNPSGAEGIAQEIPRFYPGVDVLDPAQAIPAQAGSLADYYDEFGSWAQALAAYDWGPGNVRAAVAADSVNWLTAATEKYPNGAPVEARKYVGQILTDVPLEPLPPGAMT